MIRDHAPYEYYTAANDVLNQLGAPSLAEGKQLNKQVAEGRADAQAKLAALAPALVTATVNSSNATQKKEAEELVSALPANVVQQTITALPIATIQQIAPRVYLHIASEKQRSAAQTIREKLIGQNYIVPGIQNVAGIGYIPDTLEVPYFDPDSKSKADQIRNVVTANSAKDGRVSYVIPTANDFRISPDIKTHFEVWAGKNSF